MSRLPLALFSSQSLFPPGTGGPFAAEGGGRRLPCSRRRSRSWRRGALPTKPALCGARTGSELDTGFATSTKSCWSERADVGARMGTQWSSLILAPVGRHSEKPEAFCEMIESYFPTLPKIELHARGVVSRPGWDVWGLEAPSSAELRRPDAGLRQEMFDRLA